MAVFAGLALLSACMQEDGIADSDNTGGGSLLVDNVSMTHTGSGTRASQLPVPVTSGKLGVGIRAVNGYTENRSITYTYTSGAWTSSETVLLSSNRISLYAWYPQELGQADGDNIPMTAQAYTESKDLCYAMSGGENVCRQHPYAGFVLQHAYARIKVEVFLPSFTESVVLDSVSIRATAGLKTSGTLVTRTGTINTAGVADAFSYRWDSGKTMAQLPGRIYTNDWLALPADLLTGASLIVTVDGAEWAADLSSALTRLEQGKTYRIKAAVGLFLKIESVTLEDWNNGGSVSGDTQFD